MGNGARPLIIYKSLETVSHAEFLGLLSREESELVVGLCYL